MTTPAPPTVAASVAQDLAFYRQLPPFYSLQRHGVTLERQLSLWADLLAAYALVAATTQEGADPADSDSDPDPLSAPLRVAFVLAASDPVFRNDALQRQLSAEGVATVLQAAADPREGVPRRVLPLPNGRVLLLAFPIEHLIGKIATFSSAQAVRQGDGGGRSSVHTLAELAEEPGLIPTEPLPESRLGASVASLQQMPDVVAMAQSLAGAGRATAADLLEAVAADHSCCHLLHATAVRHPQSGALRGVKISHS